MIDFGCNLAAKRYSNEFVAKFINEQSNHSPAPVDGIVSISNSIVESRRNLELIQMHEKLYCTLGIHPHNAKEGGMEELTDMLSQIGQSNVSVDTLRKVLFVGECGLDYNRNFSPPEVQRLVFTQQVALAKANGLPLYLHCRDAFEDFMTILDREDYHYGLLHCFTGTPEEASVACQRGLMIGITGFILNPSRCTQTVIALQQHVPLDRLVIETDYPYMAPPAPPSSTGSSNNSGSGQVSGRNRGRGRQRRDSDPKRDLPLILSKLAEVYQRPLEDVAATVNHTSSNLLQKRVTSVTSINPATPRDTDRMADETHIKMSV